MAYKECKLFLITRCKDIKELKIYEIKSKYNKLKIELYKSWSSLNKLSSEKIDLQSKYSSYDKLLADHVSQFERSFVLVNFPTCYTVSIEYVCGQSEEPHKIFKFTFTFIGFIIKEKASHLSFNIFSDVIYGI